MNLFFFDIELILQIKVSEKVKKRFDIVISSGEGYSNCKDYPIRSFKSWFADRYDWVDKTSRMSKNVNIILVLRERKSHMESVYNQYAKDGGKLSKKMFFSIAKDMDDYSVYIDLLKDAFDDVYVCHYEDLLKDANGFVNGICDFIGVDTPVFVNERHNESIELPPQKLKK